MGRRSGEIAQVAPLFEHPPRLYGGTERIVAYLTDELLALGRDVTLFASGDSITEGAPRPRGQAGAAPRWHRRWETVPHILMLEQVAQHAREFDVVHFHPTTCTTRWPAGCGLRT
ncbi:MAG: glycosyltransferase [Dehalococcoidia bacterium]